MSLLADDSVQFLPALSRAEAHTDHSLRHVDRRSSNVMKLNQRCFLNLAALAVSSCLVIGGAGCGEANTVHAPEAKATTTGDLAPASSNQKTPIDTASLNADRTAKAEFASNAMKLIDTLDLPGSAIFSKPAFTASETASVFVGVRCRSMLDKMRAASKSTSNLFTENSGELQAVCDSLKVTLVPGKYIASESPNRTLLYPDDSTNLEIAVRPDSSVSGFTNKTVLGGSRSEHTAVVTKSMKIDAYKSEDLETLKAVDLKGRFEFMIRHEIGATYRDDRTTKMLIFNKLQSKRILTVAETKELPAHAIFGQDRPPKTSCLITMENQDASVYAESQIDAPCFNPLIFDPLSFN